MADTGNRKPFDIGSLALLGAAYQRKILQITQANTQAAFDYAAALGNCRSPEQYAELTEDYTRRQIENFERQGRELMDLVQDKQPDAAAPSVQPR